MSNLITNLLHAAEDMLKELRDCRTDMEQCEPSDWPFAGLRVAEEDLHKAVTAYKQGLDDVAQGVLKGVSKHVPEKYLPTAEQIKPFLMEFAEPMNDKKEERCFKIAESDLIAYEKATEERWFYKALPSPMPHLNLKVIEDQAKARAHLLRNEIGIDWAADAPKHLMAAVESLSRRLSELEKLCQERLPRHDQYGRPL